MLDLADSIKYKRPNPKTFKFDNVNLEDPRVYSLISSGRTKACFQLESPIGQKYAKLFRPSSIKDLACLISILRPVCLESGMADKICRIRQGEEEPSYIHPSLEPILRETSSCLVYQESIMRICKEIAGFTDLQADDMRKATGKKLPEEMTKVKIMFIDGCKKTGIVNEAIADEIFGWIEKSVRFSFNLSHAVSYATLCYYCSYEKFFFRVPFYVAALTFSSEKLDPKQEIWELVQDARMNGINVSLPNILERNEDFKETNKNEISFGLGHIRGIGTSSVNKLINYEYPLNTFSDLIYSIKTIKRSVAESLVKSGACDIYNLSRNQMLRTIHVIFGRGKTDEGVIPEVRTLTPNEYEYIISHLDDGIQMALQGVIDNDICIKKRISTIESKIKYLNDIPLESNKTRAIWEKLYLGLNLSCSGADDIEMVEDNVKTCREVFSLPPKSKINLHVVIDAINIRKTSEKSKNPGQEFCNLSLSDNTGALTQCVIWPEKYLKFKDELVEDSVISVQAFKDVWNGRDQIVINSLTVLG